MSEWRAVPGFSRYQVSDEGVVRGNGGRVLRTEEKRGYLTLKLWSDEGERIRVGVNQLVALAFVGPRPSQSHQAAHEDGNRSNNVAGNVRWATPAENTADKVLHGTHQAGEKHPRAKLSAADVQAIRSRFIRNAPGIAAALASEFGVHPQTITNIALGIKRRTA